MQLPKKSSQCTEESVSGIKKKVNKSDEGSLAIKGGGEWLSSLSPRKMAI